MLRVIVLLLCSWIGLAGAESSTFDQDTNVLTIPSLQIGSSYYSNTRLQLHPSGQWSLIGYSSYSVGPPDSLSTGTPLSALPASISVTSGEQISLNITGGTPPYTVVSTSPVVAVASVARISASTSLATLYAYGEGSSAIIVTDNSGNQATSQVTVSPIQLNPFVTSPAAASVLTGTTVTISISGGLPPYSVISSNTHVARVDGVSQVSGRDRATATLYTIGAGTTTVMVSDSNTGMTSMTITATR